MWRNSYCKQDNFIFVTVWFRTLRQSVLGIVIIDIVSFRVSANHGDCCKYIVCGVTCTIVSEFKSVTIGQATSKIKGLFELRTWLYCRLIFILMTMHIYDEVKKISTNYFKATDDKSALKHKVVFDAVEKWQQPPT